MRGRYWSAVVLLLAVAVGSAAVAQRAVRTSGEGQGKAVSVKNGKNSRAKAARKTGNPMSITPAREAAALAFAKQNHSELVPLLKKLKTRNRRAYRQAIRQLFLDSERLARLQDTNSKRYELALKTWKLDSRIRLLAARVLLVKNPDPRLEEQLKKALGERVDVRMRQLEMERGRLEKRLQKLNTEIIKLHDRDAAVEQQLKRVKRSLGIRSRKSKGKRRRAKPRKTVTAKEPTSK